MKGIQQFIMQYEPRLDSLRAFCVLAVFAFHAEVMAFGWAGVQAFFVLSGYLITGILCKAKITASSAKSFFKVFYIRRALRIFPLYYVFIFLILILCLFNVTSNSFSKEYLRSFPYLLLYIENFRSFSFSYGNSGYFAHLWSLCVEEQFYLIWPLVVWLAPVRRLAIVCIGVILFCFLFRTSVVMFDLSQHFRFVTAPRLPLTHADAFAIGSLAQLWGKKPRLATVKSLAVSLTVVILAGVAIFVSLRGSPHQVSWRSLGWAPALEGAGAFSWGYIVLNFFFAHLVLVLANAREDSGSLLLKPFEWRVFVYLGKISYGFYVFHGPIVAFAKSVAPWEGLYMWFSIVVSLVATISISAISFKYLEGPFLKLKKHWRVKNEGDALVETSDYPERLRSPHV